MTAEEAALFIVGSTVKVLYQDRTGRIRGTVTEVKQEGHDNYVVYVDTGGDFPFTYGYRSSLEPVEQLGTWEWRM